MNQVAEPKAKALILSFRASTYIRFAVYSLVLFFGSVVFYFGRLTSLLPAVICVCVFMLFCNLIIYFYVQRRKAPSFTQVRAALAIVVFLDLLAITSVVYLTGSYESPYWTFLILEVVGAGILRTYPLMAAIVATVLLDAVLFLDYSGILPHIERFGGATPSLAPHFPQIVSLMIVIPAVMFASSFLAYYLSRLLTEREESLEKKSGELEEAVKKLSASKDELSEKSGELESSVNELIDSRSALISVTEDLEKRGEENKNLLEELRKAHEELKGRFSEVERMNKLMVGRELELIKLKEENAALRGKPEAK